MSENRYLFMSKIRFKDMSNDDPKNVSFDLPPESVMKRNGYDYDECCYEEMTKKVGGQSQPQPYWDEPFQNEYEMKRKSNFDQSGFRK